MKIIFVLVGIAIILNFVYSYTGISEGGMALFNLVIGVVGIFLVLKFLFSDKKNNFEQ